MQKPCIEVLGFQRAGRSSLRPSENRGRGKEGKGKGEGREEKEREGVNKGEGSELMGEGVDWEEGSEGMLERSKRVKNRDRKNRGRRFSCE